MKKGKIVTKGFEIRVTWEGIRADKIALVIMNLINNKSNNPLSEILDVTTKITDLLGEKGDFSVLCSGQSFDRKKQADYIYNLTKSILMSEDGFKVVPSNYNVDIVNVPYNYLENEGIVQEPFALFVRLGENVNYQ